MKEFVTVLCGMLQGMVTSIWSSSVRSEEQ